MSTERPSFNDAFRVSKRAQEKNPNGIYAARRDYYTLGEEWKEKTEKELSEKDRSIIEAARNTVGQVVRKWVPSEQLQDDVPVALSDRNAFIVHGGAMVERIEDSDYGDADLFLAAVHEQLHARSFTDAVVTNTYKKTQAGLDIIIESPKETRRYFQGLNEACTMDLETLGYGLLPDEHTFKQAIKDRAEEVIATIQEEDPLTRILETMPWIVTMKRREEDSETFRVLSHYYEDVFIRSRMTVHIAKTLPETYADANQVGEVIEKAYFTGDFHELKSAIREVYGPKGMLIASRWRTVEKFYPPEVIKKIKQFFSGKECGDVDQLLREVEVSVCSTCLEETGGSVCLHCGAKREMDRKKNKEETIECKFCGSFIGVSNGVCRECGS
ncbi:hypothetical protein COV06_02785 [Candidatus Uhrbacteria bacterium CG10_big_fil_rev_8_21_14_0_10_50_16]|uniref:Uncharacterized protein n=1 Tax=Candidatus Uhrbacteria bacterium CG10_big_fil_rev_8_21_14_0_10_50_16 TaxID=1975039 RepID=A0A2H0RM60_9BACT|nr:MAG: hypothetical protein COV06_02785 [Candidatus Uhrbacteria bacterium CG10_big_fil_rev_8_21_14_0_10_50_16]